MEIIELAKQLGKKLTESDEYIAFCKTRDICKENKLLKQKLDEFKVQKAVLDVESEKEDKDEMLCDAINARVETLYKEIMENEQMKAYNKAEEDLNLLMTAINMTITSFISPENLKTNSAFEGDDSDDTDGECTHNCATCRGCH